MNEKDVVAYLASNPDFLVRNSDLFERLLPPSRPLGDSVSDLQQVMVARLRGQVDALRSSQKELISNGRANEGNLARINQAVLMLIEADSVSEMARVISQDLPDVLGVDAVSLALESNETFSEDGSPGLKRLEKGAIESMMGPANAMLRANSGPYPDLFTEPDAVRSVALMRLEMTGDRPDALLAFGSHDPEWFTPDQGTDMVAFLAGVAARCLQRFVKAEMREVDYA